MMSMRLRDFVCPICNNGNRYVQVLKCPHKDIEIFEWQAREIERLTDAISDYWKTGNTETLQEIGCELREANNVHLAHK